MHLSTEEIKKLFQSPILKNGVRNTAKGPTALFYKGKPFLIWRDENFVYLQEKGLFKKKHAFLASAVLDSKTLAERAFCE